MALSFGKIINTVQS